MYNLLIPSLHCVCIMAICKYFKLGNCKFGHRCNFEHPRGLIPDKTGSSTVSATAEEPIVTNITVDSVKADLTTDKPGWPFTSYCPVKYGFSNLISDQDLSFEEARSWAYQANNTGTFAAYEQELLRRNNNLNTEIQQILVNLPAAVQQAQSANSVPSQSNPNQVKPAESVFGQVQQGQRSCGQTAQPQSAFGMAAKSQLAQPTSSLTQSAFGQPSLSQSAFGQPSRPQSVFGSKATVTQGAFGQTSLPQSAFGQPSQPQSAFGQTSQTQQNAFGQTSLNHSAFGEASKTSTSSAFGQTSQTQSAFGQSPLPQIIFDKPAQTQNAFGQTTPAQGAFGQTPQTQSVFAQASQPQSAFGQQPSVPQSVFGQKTQPQSAFGQPPALNSSSPFTQIPSTDKPSSFGGTTSVFGGVGANTQASASPFDQANTAITTSAFRPAPTTAFGSKPVTTATKTTQATNPTTTQTPSVFGTTAQPMNHVSAFSIANTAAPSAFPAQQSKAQSGFGHATGLSAVSVQGQHDLDIAATPDDVKLPEDILDCFRADHFVLGKIPEVPPPKGLCR